MHWEGCKPNCLVFVVVNKRMLLKYVYSIFSLAYK